MKICNNIIITVLACVASACSADTPLDISDSMVVPTASIVVPSLTRADFTGPVNGTSFTPSTDRIFGVTAYIDTQVPTSWVPTSRINNDAVHSDELGFYFFDKNKFYPREGNLYFYAFSPMVNSTYADGTATEHPRVTYHITGREDIMWAKNESGIGHGISVQDQPNFVFTHKLQRVIFSVRRSALVPSSALITEIRISGLRTVATLDLVDGALTFDAGQDLTHLSVVCDYVPELNYTTVPYDLMFEAGIKEFDLTVVMNGADYNAHVVMADDHAGEAGYKHLLQITMTGESLVVNQPKVVEWESLTFDGTI